MKDVIALKDVWKIYKEGEENQVIALKDVSLKISKGDFIAIMGPSGSGKSTGMNLIGSLDVPSRGKVFLDRHNVSHLSESDLAQVRGKKIGFIFQQFNLIPNLTAKENIILPMIFQGTEEWEREEKARELLNLVELQDREDHYPSELSGGQQQRVAIARALANDPEIILADEPTGNLDTKTGVKIMDFLSDMNKNGKTVIIITHEPEIALKHARTIYWMKDGQIEKITRKVKGKWRKVKNEK
ncbi:MAG TPA: ABC transporter ATP-binding protein [Candidatus Nanoarchaeia archaeon]|nr:ABC transporter ATP-binding protein [Candidatus Nanoarchaeia archaeon]